MTVETWSVLVGAFLPALVAFVNRAEWASWIKGLVALGTSALAGTVTALLSGEFTGTSWLTAIGVVFASAQASYALWWKTSGIAGKIESGANIIPPSPEKPGAHRAVESAYATETAYEAEKKEPLIERSFTKE